MPILARMIKAYSTHACTIKNIFQSENVRGRSFIRKIFENQRQQQEDGSELFAISIHAYIYYYDIFISNNRKNR